MTKLEAIKITRELWVWMRDEKKSHCMDKEDWPGWRKYGEMRNSCPCCEYVRIEKSRRNDFGLSCMDLCPLIKTAWPDGCEAADSLYRAFELDLGTPADAQRIIDGCDDALKEMFHVGQKVTWTGERNNVKGDLKVSCWPVRDRHYEISRISGPDAWLAEVGSLGQWIPLHMLTPVEEGKETTMNRVTIQDVLDAGGEIFGLPCKDASGRNGFCFSGRAAGDGEVGFVWIKEGRYSGTNHGYPFKPADLEVVPGGVIITKHYGNHELQHNSIDDEGFAIRRELLIPENTALQAAQRDVADAQRKLEAAQAKLDKLK